MTSSLFFLLTGERPKRFSPPPSEAYPPDISSGDVIDSLKSSARFLDDDDDDPDDPDDGENGDFAVLALNRLTPDKGNIGIGHLGYFLLNLESSSQNDEYDLFIL